jgi:hypothetical protein
MLRKRGWIRPNRPGKPSIPSATWFLHVNRRSKAEPFKGINKAAPPLFYRFSWVSLELLSLIEQCRAGKLTFADTLYRTSLLNLTTACGSFAVAGERLNVGQLSESRSEAGNASYVGDLRRSPSTLIFPEPAIRSSGSLLNRARLTYELFDALVVAEHSEL